VFDAFANKWIASADPVEERNLAQVQQDLGVNLPNAYRRFVLQHGIPFCPGLLSGIVDGEHDLHDIQEFVGVDDLRGATSMYVSAGMDPGFVGFATDCMGNMFLFRKADCILGGEDAPVWFFDHDFVTIDEVAPSFVEWLKGYLTIEKVAEG
jgi:hypothetical protein